jgi:hypothetical protein
MHDEPIRMLGLAGLRITCVIVRDDALDLEVEGVVPAGARTAGGKSSRSRGTPTSRRSSRSPANSSTVAAWPKISAMHEAAAQDPACTEPC